MCAVRTDELAVLQLEDVQLLEVGNTIQLAGVVYAGGGKVYLVEIPGEEPASDGPGDELVRLRLDSQGWEVFLRQTDLMETEVLARAADGKIVKAILRKSQRQVEQGVSWRVFRRDGFACRYCGRDDVPLTVDHLVLWEVGGPSTEANLLAACRKCNRTRGSMPYETWLESKEYKRLSAGLSNDAREANQDVLRNLGDIPLRRHTPSRK